MATKKITITLPEEALARLREKARAAGLPLSTYVARVTEHHARIQEGLAEMAQWEEEHGPFSDEELAGMDVEIARAEKPLRAGYPTTKVS